MNFRARRLALWALAKIVNDFAFGPASVITIGIGQKGAMSTISAFVEGNMRVRRHLGASLCRDSYEGIICGMQDEGRYGNLIDDLGSGGALVIIGRTRKPAIGSSHLVIKLAKRLNSLGARRVKMAWEKPRLFS